MKRLSLRTLTFLVLTSSSISMNAAFSQEAGNAVPAAPNAYYGPTSTQPEAKPLGRQRAEQRARQRLTRMESMRWYGFSASRPTAAGVPFTTMYSPQWTRPGGRPFAWYTSQRPVVSTYYPSYYH